MARLSPVRSQVLKLTVLLTTALAAPAAGADVTVAPTPLYATPELSGAPLRTLPTGKVLTTVERRPSLQPNGKAVLAVVDEGQVRYARAGTVREGETGVRVSGPEWFLPPQPAGAPLTVFLHRDARRPAGKVTSWVLRALPLDPARLDGQAPLRVTGPARLTRTVTASGERQAADLGRLAPGLYLVTVAGADAPATVLAAEVLQVTDLALTALAIPTGVDVWATRLDSGAALPGVRVRGTALRPSTEAERAAGAAYWRPSRTLAPVTTDARGLARFALRDGERLRVTGTAQVDGVTHRAALGDSYGLGAGDPERARTFLQTDKPVYRPGETLSGFAVARRLGAGTRAPYRGPLTVRLLGSYGEVVLGQQQVTADADGLARFSFPLPDGVRTGEYMVEARVPGPVTPDNPVPLPDLSHVPVRVQAFVKPQFTLDLKLPTEIVSGAPLPVMALAERYEGGGADVPVDLTLTGGDDRAELWAEATPGGTDRPDFEAESGEFWRSGPELDADRVPTARLRTTGGRGRAALTPTAPKGLPRNFTVVARARDEYGRDVLTDAGVTVHPAGLKLELLSWPTLADGNAGAALRVRAVGSGTPLPGRTVQATVVRAWTEAMTVGSRPDYKSRQAVVSRVTLRSGADGGIRVLAPAAAPGSYTLWLEARDAQGRVTRANVSLGYVPDPAGQGMPRPFTLGLDSDRGRYRVGDTVRLTLRSDLPHGTPVLLSAAAEGRVTTRTVRITGPQQEVTWPVTPDLAPGFTLEAAAVAGADSLRAGTGLLYVPRMEQQLSVTVQPSPRAARPGEEVSLSVRTRAGSRGVPALVTLAVVNEAVYALAGDPSPDPWRFLWGAAYPRLEISSSAGMPGDGGRGGGGGGGSGMPARSDLREVAFFRSVRTGPDGHATVKVRLPEALGHYRITARAFTRGGAAGASRSELRAELPFAVRLIRPRVLTHGDQGSAFVGVQDRTGLTRAAAHLSAGGLTLSRPLILSAGNASTRFPLHAPDRGTALTLEARAEGAGGQTDALREMLPLRPAGPRARITAEGSMPRAGTRDVPLKVSAGASAEALTLTLAATPLQAALAGLDTYLADGRERWVTTDAVAARLRTNLDLAALARPLGWPDVRERARTQARRDLATLLALRASQDGPEAGGWGWTAQGQPTPDQTAHALAALAQAKGAGLTDAATLAWAVQAARTWRRDTLSTGDRTRLVDALAAAGDVAPALALTRANGPQQPADLARLAAALAVSPAAQARDTAASLYARARAAARPTSSGGLLLDDPAGNDTAATAHLLAAALALGETADQAPLTATLLDRRTGGAWGDPLTTAAALAALRGAVEREARRPPTQATLHLGTQTRTVTLGPPLRLPLTPPASGPVTLRLSADGPLAYRADLDLRAAGAVPSRLSPLGIERRYDRSRVERDGVVTVTLTVRTPTAARHLRLTDPLPGGLEAIDDRPFAYPGSVNGAGRASTTWAERAIFDDRAVFYLDRIPAGVTTVRYRLRALAPGSYTAPAPRLEATSGLPPAAGQAQRVEVTGE